MKNDQNNFKNLNKNYEKILFKHNSSYYKSINAHNKYVK